MSEGLCVRRRPLGIVRVSVGALVVCFSVRTREKRSEAERGGTCQCQDRAPCRLPSTHCAAQRCSLFCSPSWGRSRSGRTASRRHVSCHTPSHKSHLKQICKINDEYFYNVFNGVFDLQKQWWVLAGISSSRSWGSVSAACSKWTGEDATAGGRCWF